MGQVFGVPDTQPDFVAFVNLPREAIESIWMSFNLHGEGWGLDCDQLKEIFLGASYMKDTIGFQMEDIIKLFKCFDTDENNLIDALELLITLALASGMDTIDKLLFCFSMYDFDQSGELSKDEVSLLLRTAVSGMGKICHFALPSSEDLEKTTDLIFKDADRSNDHKLSIYEFQTYCCIHPVVSSWLRCYSSLVTSYKCPDEGLDDPDVSNMTFTFASKKSKLVRASSFKSLASVPTSERPWFNTADLMLPEEIPTVRPDPPEDILEPVWLHGQRCFDARGMVRYGAKGNILFVTSAIGVNMSKDPESGHWNQKFMFDHDAPLTCLDVDNSLRIVATADRVDGALGGNQGEAKIIFWDSISNIQIGSISVTGCRGIRYIDFSPDAKFIICLSTDEQNFLMMYEVATLRMVYSTHLGSAKIMDVKFTHSDSIFAVAGSEGIDFFTEEGGSYMSSSGMKIYEKRPGLFQAVGRDAAGVVVSCLSEFERSDEMVSGDVNGNVLFWRGRNCLQLLKAHKCAVTSMAYSHNSKKLVSGGRDGKINIYKVVDERKRPGTANRRRNSFQAQPQNVGRTIEVVTSFDMTRVDVVCPEIRSVSLWEDGKRVLVSAISGEIVEMSCVGATGAISVTDVEGDDGEKVLRVGDDVNGEPLLRAHWEKFSQPSVYGLCKLAAGGFLSCGSDGMIRQWQTGDEVQHKEIKHVEMGSGLRCITTSASNIAVGMDGSRNQELNGTVKVLGLEDFKSVADLKDATDMITAVAFSPDGNALAAASADTNVYVYTSADGQWTLKGACTGHCGGVMNVDFSADGQFIRSSDRTEELIVWDVIVNFGAQVTDPETLKPVTWATNTVPLCWDLKGVFDSLREGETVECVDRMHHLAVLGLSSGAMILSRIPASVTHDHRREEAHCGRISCVCFIDDGARMVTAGAEDGLVQVWKATYDFDELEVTEPEEKGEEEEENEPEKNTYYDSGDDEDLMEVSERPMGSDAVLCRIRNSMLTEERAASEKGSVKAESVSGRSSSQKSVSQKSDGGADESKGGDASVDEDAGQEVVVPKTPLELIEEFEADQFVYDKSKSVEANWLAANPWAKKLQVTEDSLKSTPAVPPPRAEIQLDWIYGFSGRGTRSSVQYCADGNIAYPVSTVAVILNKVKGVQTHSMNHSDEITCLDVHQASGKAATGQRSTECVFVSVWATDTGKCLRHLNCGAVNAASAICFSPSGEYVAVACQDLTHSIIIFDWTNNVLKCRVPGGSTKVLGLVFSVATCDTHGTLRLMQVGLGHFHVLKIKGRQMSSKRGKFGGAKQNVLCAAALPLSTKEGNEFAIGLEDGSIGVIARGEKNISNSVSIHSKSVTAMCAVKLTDGNEDENCTYKLVSGGADGMIKVLNQDLEPLSEYNVYKESYGLYIMGKCRGIKSLCVDKSCRKILYGTAGGEVAEIDINDGSDLNGAPLVSSHCRDELHGMVTHPMKLEAASVGDDKTLRVWHLEKRKLMAMLELPDIARTVCYSPTGQIIAVGLGGHVHGENRVPRKCDGHVVIVSYMQGSLRIVHEISDSRKPISCLAFSADGSELYVGSEDGKVYVYNIHEDFNKIFEYGQHTAGITGIDISEDGKILCTCDMFNNVIYWDQSDEDKRGEILDESKIRKVLPKTKWFVRQNVLGLDSIGVQKVPFEMGHALCLSESRDRSLLATGDCNGGLSLFHSPCKKPSAPFTEMIGHCPGGISRVSFATKDKYILTAGKYDRSLFQWRLEKSSGDEDGEVLPSRPTTTMKLMEKLGTDKELDAMTEVTPLSFNNDSMLINGVNFAKDSTPELPKVKPQSLSVLGLSCASFTKQVTALPVGYYCGSGDVITCAGCLPVAISSNRTIQSHWQVPKNEFGYNEDIGVIAVSTDGRTVAMCEKAPGLVNPLNSAENFQGRQFVFNGSNGMLLSVLPGTIGGGVVSATFSHDSHSLACVGCCAHHSFTIFHSVEGNWKDPVRLFHGQIDTNPVTVVVSIMQSPTNMEFQYATAGRGRLRLWKVRGRNAVSSPCDISGPMEAITAMVSVGAGQLITGDASGTVSLWDGKSCLETISKAHSRRVSAVCYFESSQSRGGIVGFMTASNDTIKIWNLNMEVLQEFAVVDVLFRVNRVVENTYVTSMCTDSVFKRLLITLSNSLIAEISIDSGAVMLLTEGHTSGSFVAIAAHPKEPRILVTGGYDGWLKCWDIRSQAALEVLNVGEPISSIVFRDDGQSFAISLNDTVTIMEFDVFAASKFKVMHKISKVGKGKIPLLRYSPDESVLAAGSADGHIYILDVDNKYSKTGNLKGHTRAIEGFDFSKSGKYLRSFSRDPENEAAIRTLFHVVEKGSTSTYELIEQPDDLVPLTRASWKTVSSPAAPEGRGMRVSENQIAATSIPVIVTSTAVSVDGELLAVGYSDGNVKLFRNPACSVDAQSVDLIGHAKGGVACSFSADGKYLYTAGSMDGSVIVWDMYGGTKKKVVIGRLSSFDF